MKLISIIVPCLNEQEVIPIFYRTVTEVLDSLENAEYELLFVDDGSDDRTLKVLKELKKKDRRCRYLSFTRNFGKEAAIYAGLIHAKGDYVGLMDVDLQDPPTFLGEMYRRLVSMTAWQQEGQTGQGKDGSGHFSLPCFIK